MNETKSIEELHGYVRLALPLMSEQNIPITPRNYGVWYEYVSGNNTELRETLDKMIEKGEEFSEEKNETLYRQFCAEKDENELRKLREELQQLLVTILTEVTDLSGQTEKYESFVSKSVDKLSESQDISVQNIRNVVNEIVVETKQIGKSGKTLQEKLKKTTEELDVLQREFEQAKTESLVDFLTGAANRKAFDETLTNCAEEAASENNDLCLLMIDIDHFKRFNDEYGHIVGDEVLKFVTARIQEIVRGGDLVARFGGEEFAVILAQTPLQGAKTVAENIRAFFEKTKLKAVGTSRKLGVITVSLGVARYRPGEPLEKFINRSDKALYFAKKTGRNRVATESDV